MHTIRRRLVGAIIAASAAAAMSGCVSVPSGGEQPDQGQSQETNRPSGGNAGEPGKGQPDNADSESSNESSEDSESSNPAPVVDDQTADCGSKNVSGETFTMYHNQQRGTVNGKLTITNNGSEPCTLSTEFGPKLSSMDGPIMPGGADNVRYEPTLPPEPKELVLEPGQQAATELSWQESGDNCEAVVHGASVQLAPEDEPVMASANDPDGKIDQSSLCGDGTVRHSGFWTL